MAVLVLISNAVVMALAFARLTRRRAHEVVAISWAFAMSATLNAWGSALIFGTPRWVPGVGFVASLGTLIVATRMALRSRGRHS